MKSLALSCDVMQRHNLLVRKSLEQLEIEADVALQVVNIVEGAVGVELELLLLRLLRPLSGSDAVEKLPDEAKRIHLIVVQMRSHNALIHDRMRSVRAVGRLRCRCRNTETPGGAERPPSQRGAL